MIVLVHLCAYMYTQKQYTQCFQVLNSLLMLNLSWITIACSAGDTCILEWKAQ